jgi:hypothetical protein
VISKVGGSCLVRGWGGGKGSKLVQVEKASWFDLKN